MDRDLDKETNMQLNEETVADAIWGQEAIDIYFAFLFI